MAGIIDSMNGYHWHSLFSSPPTKINLTFPHILNSSIRMQKGTATFYSPSHILLLTPPIALRRSAEKRRLSLALQFHFTWYKLIPPICSISYTCLVCWHRYFHFPMHSGPTLSYDEPFELMTGPICRGKRHKMGAAQSRDPRFWRASHVCMHTSTDTYKYYLYTMAELSRSDPQCKS